MTSGAAKVAFGVRSRGLRIVACGVFSLGTGAGAWAVPERITATQANSPQSSFTLDFGQGSLSSANITATEFELVIDPATGSAQFLRYEQDVEPLLLPDGQGGAVSTGAIRVKICRDGDASCASICQAFDCSSTGAFDRATGAFEIQNDVYRIDFDGDLSVFGITSPFVLPSTSLGGINFATPSDGSTDMDWIGMGLLAEVIPFSYTCSVHGEFTIQSEITYVATTTPAPGAVDARQPHAMDDQNLLFGWDSLEVVFNAAPTQPLSVTAFQTQGADVHAQPLTLTGVISNGGPQFTLSLSDFIAPQSWATITHTASGTNTCLGVLPGDVDGDGLNAGADALALVYALDSIAGYDLADYSKDIDRSGIADAEDVVRLMDLFNGAGAFEPWAGAAIGAATCQ